jgi:integrase
MKPFQIKGRSGWHAEVRLPDGRTRRKKFRYEKDARAWLVEEQARVKASTGEAFGGPGRVTLGALLVEYAKLKTIQKLGYKAEIERINRYVVAAGYPALKIVETSDGQRVLDIKSDGEMSTTPTGWLDYLDTRRSRSAKFHEHIHTLANKLCSQITPADIEEIKARIAAAGLSDSTAQKEVALLKHCFNVAINTWKWKNFENPCVGVKLKVSAKHFVHVSDEQMARLRLALSECDNPYIWPLVEFALSSAMRKHSLLGLRWDHINLEGRTAHIWAKGRWADVPLSQRSVDILAKVPRTEDGRVFPLSDNALKCAWDGVRIKAGLPKLEFRELRHLAATYYARKGATATTLKNLLAHTSTRMAERYIDMTMGDSSHELDRLDGDEGSSPATQLPTFDPNGPKKHPRARKPTQSPEVALPAAPTPTPDAETPGAAAQPPSPTKVVNLADFRKRAA